MSGGKPIAVIGAAIKHIGKGGLSLMTVCLCVAFVARVGAAPCVQQYLRAEDVRVEEVRLPEYELRLPRPPRLEERLLLLRLRLLLLVLLPVF